MNSINRKEFLIFLFKFRKKLNEIILNKKIFYLKYSLIIIKLLQDIKIIKYKMIFLNLI